MGDGCLLEWTWFAVGAETDLVYKCVYSSFSAGFLVQLCRTCLSRDGYETGVLRSRDSLFTERRSLGTLTKLFIVHFKLIYPRCGAEMDMGSVYVGAETATWWSGDRSSRLH